MSSEAILQMMMEVQIGLLPGLFVALYLKHLQIILLWLSIVSVC